MQSFFLLKYVFFTYYTFGIIFFFELSSFGILNIKLIGQIMKIFSLNPTKNILERV